MAVLRTRTTTVLDSPILRGKRWRLTIGIRGIEFGPETGAQHVAAHVLAAILADHAGDAEQAAAWLEDALAMAQWLPLRPSSADRQGSHERRHCYSGDCLRGSSAGDRATADGNPSTFDPVGCECGCLPCTSSPEGCGSLAFVRKLAREAADACARREAALAAMTPEERDRAVAAWARKLAADAAEWSD